MKTKKFLSKLVLNKQVVANLSPEELVEAVGGNSDASYCGCPYTMYTCYGMNGCPYPPVSLCCTQDEMSCSWQVC